MMEVGRVFSDPWLKWEIRLLLCVPCFHIVVMILQGRLGSNPVETMILETGEATVHLLVAVMWISPLRVLLSRFDWPKRLLRHKRDIGVACWIYASVHLTLYMLDNLGGTLLENLQKPFIVVGIAAWILLTLLAVTSPQCMLRKLGGKRWKALHRSVYGIAVLACFHMLLKEKSQPMSAYLHFIPLLCAETIRLGLHLRFRFQNLSS
ncbi:MAG: ferric reductase-like transmembrane domain-containing protein [SAR324 cluster bacterium]|nr:ferric reductase-like transmembrane domain-containing protein [SAR324 cluster bacterium]